MYSFTSETRHTFTERTSGSCQGNSVREQEGLYLAWQSRSDSEREAVESSRGGRASRHGSISIHLIHIGEPEVFLHEGGVPGGQHESSRRTRPLHNSPRSLSLLYIDLQSCFAAAVAAALKVSCYFWLCRIQSKYLSHNDLGLQACFLFFLSATCLVQASFHKGSRNCSTDM